MSPMEPPARPPCQHREEANRPVVTDPQAVPVRAAHHCELGRDEWPNCGRCPLYIPMGEAGDD